MGRHRQTVLTRPSDMTSHPITCRTDQIVPSRNAMLIAMLRSESQGLPSNASISISSPPHPVFYCHYFALRGSGACLEVHRRAHHYRVEQLFDYRHIGVQVSP